MEQIIDMEVPKYAELNVCVNLGPILLYIIISISLLRRSVLLSYLIL